MARRAAGLAATPAVAADAAAVTEVVAALESSLYAQTAFSQADLEDEWLELDLRRDARVVRDGDRVVGYGVVRERGELWRVEGYVHPDALGRGIGRLTATGLEEEAARGGARRIQNGVLEADSAARRLLESLGYGAVRVLREMRIELEAPPPAPECVVRAEDEIAAGTICTGDTYDGGFVHALFTRRPWRRQGVGAALLAASFRRFWERGEHSVGLGVDAASDTGAFASTRAPGWRPRSAGCCTRRSLAMLLEPL
jgi:GNAT superfamily N-acetyltransferase